MQGDEHKHLGAFQGDFLPPGQGRAGAGGEGPISF